MKQKYFFAVASLFVGQIIFAQPNRNETNRNHSGRIETKENTLRSSNDVFTASPTKETPKQNRNLVRQSPSVDNRRKVENNYSSNQFSMHTNRDDKKRNERSDAVVRTPNNNNVRTKQHNDYSNNNVMRNDAVANRNVQQRNNDNQARFGNNNRYNRIDRNYYPDYRRPYSFIGVRYTNFYSPRFILPHRGMNYYYSGGFFYQPFNNYFQVIIAPVGIRTFGLPWGYRRWNIGRTRYYYFGGTYYRNINNYYEVVEAPLGSILPELPNGASSTIINNEQYFQLNGTYYKETLRNGEVWYTIVGKNGRIDTSIETIEEETAMIGDIVTDLPDDCKMVIINNQKYFVSNHNLYYKELIIENSLYYKITDNPQ